MTQSQNYRAMAASDRRNAERAECVGATDLAQKFRATALDNESRAKLADFGYVTKEK